MLSAMSVGLFVCLFVLGGLSLLVVGVFVTHTHTHTHKKQKNTEHIFHKTWIWAQNRTRLTSGGDPDKRRVQEFFLTFLKCAGSFFFLTFLSLPGEIIHKSSNISTIIHGKWILDLVSFDYKKFWVFWVIQGYQVWDWIYQRWLLSLRRRYALYWLPL